MALVDAFCGIRYSTASGKDISDRIAPPYDVVVTEQAKAKLLAKSPHNIIAIDMPHTPPKTAGPEHAYDRAGRLLNQWLDQEVMIRDNTPAIYVYQQRYTHLDRQYCRRGFIARLRLEEFGKGNVFPHEQTYGGPKEDRMLLTKFTRANLSQVFCLFDDDTNQITETLYGHISRQPDYCGTLEDASNEVWILTDPKIIRWLRDKMTDRKIFIADGHHRYSTSLMYRNYLASRGELTPEHPANYVGCMFVSMSEPGLVILPTHRCIHDLQGLTLDVLAENLQDMFETRWERSAHEMVDLEIGFMYHGDDRILVAKPRDPDHLLDDLSDRYVLAWRELPISILHSYILDRCVYPHWLKTERPVIEYFHLAREVVEYLQREKNVLAAIVPPTPIEAVRQISLANQLMPQKSTFFYPKLATGLVIHPLFDL